MLFVGLSVQYYVCCIMCAVYCVQYAMIIAIYAVCSWLAAYFVKGEATLQLS